jgi:hypothetical protein
VALNDIHIQKFGNNKRQILKNYLINLWYD